jgi:hypothetical protein
VRGTEDQRWLAVYGAAFVAEWREWHRLGREVRDEHVERFVAEAEAVADWAAECEPKGKP